MNIIIAPNKQAGEQWIAQATTTKSKETHKYIIVVDASDIKLLDGVDIKDVLITLPDYDADVYISTLLLFSNIGKPIVIHWHE